MNTNSQNENRAISLNNAGRHTGAGKANGDHQDVFVQVDGSQIKARQRSNMPRDLVATQTASKQEPQDSVGVWHTSVIHFPIAWLFLLVFVEIIMLIKRKTMPFVPAFRWFVCLAFIPAIVTGLVHAEILDLSGNSAKIFSLPADFNSPQNHDLKEHLVDTLLSGLFLSIAVILSAIPHRINSKTASPALKKMCYAGYCGFLGASLLFLIDGAHHGGELTHGDDVPSCSMH